MMKFGGELPIFNYCLQISAKLTHVEGKSVGKGPLFREFRAQNPDNREV